MDPGMRQDDGGWFTHFLAFKLWILACARMTVGTLLLVIPAQAGIYALVQ